VTIATWFVSADAMTRRGLAALVVFAFVAARLQIRDGRRAASG
jgi:hypothetical protein